MSYSSRKRYSLAEQMREEHKTDAPNNLAELFDEEPVDLETFVKDKKYLANPDGLYPWQFDFNRHIEQIFDLDTYIAMVEEFGEQWIPVRMVNYLIAEVGKSGGKDHGCRVGVCRGAYLLNCLKNPQMYYKLAPQDDIHTLNVAPTSNLARRVFFKPLGQLLTRSPWFKSHILSEITPNSTSILLTKQVELVSGHSMIESFEGLNPIIALADEIAAFRLEQLSSGVLPADSRSAESVWAVLRSSARSRFPNNFKCAAISYPRYLNDMIERLIGQGNKDIAEKGIENSRYYVFGPKGTVEVNPQFFGQVAEEVFSEDFEEDFDKASAMYKCAPQRSPNRFFRNDTAIRLSFPKVDEPPLEISYYWANDDPEAEQVAAEIGTSVPLSWQVHHALNSSVVPMAGCLYAVHADLAKNGDRAGIAMAHVRTWKHASPDAPADDRPIVKLDFVTAYEADLTASHPDTGEIVPREIQLRWVRKLIRELSARGFPIMLVTFDGWQSMDSTQIIQSWGIDAKLQSIDRTPMPYQTLRDVLYDGRLEAYDDGILIKELEGLTKMPNGRIDHPADGSKDEADAVCGAVLGAISLGGDEGDRPETVDAELRGMVPLLADGYGNGGIEAQDLTLSATWEEMTWAG